MPIEASTPTSPARRRLGKGLGSLISAPVRIDLASPPSSTPTGNNIGSSKSVPSDSSHILGETDTQGLQLLDTSQVLPNPKQPRQHFDDESLNMLAASISTSGLMQPIVVRPATGQKSPASAFQIIAGERRWRAAQLAGLTRIPVIIRDVDDRTAAELSLVENLQREDLNPMERADAFRRLVDEFGLSHQEIASQVGLDRSSITNHLRLHELDEPIRLAVRDGRLSIGHAKALLSITNLSRRTAMAQQAVKGGWSVRELERRAKPAPGSGGHESEETPARSVNRASTNAVDLAKRLGEHLGTKVQVKPGRNKGSGRLIIDFYSLDQFEGLLHRLQYNGD